MSLRITTLKLFKLIKTLKKEEKRYFKLFTKNNRYKQGKYLEIFEVLNKQDNLDLDRYKKQLQHIKQLSSLQSYLYEQILQSLQTQYTSSNIERQIMDGLIRIELLFERHLMEEANALVSKIEKLATDYDKPLFLPLIYMWWFKIENSFLRYKDTSSKQFGEYKDKARKIMAVLTDYIQYYTAVSEGVFLKQYESSRTLLPALEQLEQAIDSYVPQHPESIPVKIIYLQLKAFFASVKYNYSDAYSYWSQLDQFLATMSPQLLEHYQYLYYDVIHSCAYNGSFVAPKTEIPSLLQKLATIPNSNSATQFIVVKHKLMLKMGQYQNALDYVNQATLDFSYLPLNYKFTFHYNLGVNYFIIRQYDEALNAFDVILEEKSTQVPHIRVAAFILKIITFYEKDEYLVLPYLLSTIQRQLKSAGILFQFEQLFLKFIKKIIRHPKSDRAALFIKFKEQYLEFIDQIEHSEQKEFLVFFNYQGWIDSHITNQKFANPFT
ncbi:tetratricopeptide repeat protein [Aureispira anguillae]|uniref:Tetratricopeptide repeat protein n=1 Tax=Aureispira anguillae TaxID=2864201 RepID=A0A916DV96_9BACT|nr:tetratricopeptide repeat protein [Aureispira anguillae]BDS14904.1 tetratricopeptide repeat protein [Aureispira anguillae]